MIKNYQSSTQISLNILLPNKKNMHIVFSPISNGTSTYVTDNEVIQNALERHYQFGKLFRLVGSSEHKKNITKSVCEDKREQGVSDSSLSDESVISPNSDKEVKDSGLRIVKVSDIAAAKDYLADTFGVSRTYLRGIKSITESAKANGIVFEGI